MPAFWLGGTLGALIAGALWTILGIWLMESHRISPEMFIGLQGATVAIAICFGVAGLMMKGNE